jgi:hypothetical protein
MIEDGLNSAEMLERLASSLRELPDADARLVSTETMIDNHNRLDGIIEAEVAGRELLLIIETRRDAFPRDVREAIWQLRNYQHHIQSTERQVMPFLVAAAISSGARETLRHENVGFYDMGGTLFLPARGAYIFIDRAVPRKSRKIFDTIFKGQRARVLQTLFDRKGDWLAVKDVNEASFVSPATASQTLAELERREWVQARGSGPTKTRKLVQPEKLVEGWQLYLASQKPLSLKRYYVPEQSADKLMRRLDDACHSAGAEYAITGEAAANAYTPHLSSISQVRCRLGPVEAGKIVLERIDARPVQEGWNLAIIDDPSVGKNLLCERRDGINYAKPLQVYLDLLQGSGRSKEMAAHLRSEGLGL